MKSSNKPGSKLLDQGINTLVNGFVKEPIVTGLFLGIVVGVITSSASGFMVGIALAYVMHRIITDRAFI